MGNILRWFHFPCQKDILPNHVCTLPLVCLPSGITIPPLVYAVTPWSRPIICSLIVLWPVVGSTGFSLSFTSHLLWLLAFPFVTCFLALTLMNFFAYSECLHTCCVCANLKFGPSAMIIGFGLCNQALLISSPPSKLVSSFTYLWFLNAFVLFVVVASLCVSGVAMAPFVQWMVRTLSFPLLFSFLVILTHAFRSLFLFVSWLFSEAGFDSPAKLVGRASYEGAPLTLAVAALFFHVGF